MSNLVIGIIVLTMAATKIVLAGADRFDAFGLVIGTVNVLAGIILWREGVRG